MTQPGPSRERKDRMSLGIALLHAVALPGVEYTCEEIAAWADCHRSAIAQIEHQALKKIRKLLYCDRVSRRDLSVEMFDRRTAAKIKERE